MDSPPDPGRRANGLPSSDWGALVDLDPRLSAALLDRLAQAGVPAYVEPATAVDTVHRAVVMPGRPLDRLWVDPARADSARAVVASEVADLTALLAEDEPGATAHGLVQPVPRNAARRVLPPPALPGPPGARPSDDDLFAAIVAGYDRDPSDEARRWPAAEDLPPAGDEDLPPAAKDLPPGAKDLPSAPEDLPPAAPAQPDEATRTRRRTDAAGPALPSESESSALEDDGHFVPPPPPPVPRVRARTLGAVLCVLLGLVLLFAPSALGLGAGQGVGLLGLVLLGGGAGALVWWMRDSTPDSGPGDGAVV